MKLLVFEIKRTKNNFYINKRCCFFYECFFKNEHFCQKEIDSKKLLSFKLWPSPELWLPVLVS